MSSSRSSHAVVRWVVEQVTGRDIGRKPPKRARTMQRGPYRNFRYRAWVRSLPSAASGLMPCECCHTGSDGGMSQKSSDTTCIPLTVEEHREYHQIGKPAFEAKYQIDCQQIARRLAATWFKYSAEVK